MQTASKKVVNGWAMYDWANSVYNLVITATMFPAYYEEVTKGENGTGIVRFLGRDFVNTALYNYALGFAFLIVAFISPVLSSIADYRGNKKHFMRFFSTLGSISCSMLFFFKGDNLNLGITTVILACIGFWSSLVFYNSYLPEIAAEEDRDRISAKGFSMGYIGSVLLQLICFVLLFKKEWFGFTTTDALRTSFLLVGVWWLAFSQIPLAILPISPRTERKSKHHVLANGFMELRKVWLQLSSMPVLKRFLFAFFFYNMGVQTIMLAATLYGKSELGIPVSNLIVSILLIQLVAIPGAYLISRLSSMIGNIKSLMIVVAIWVLLCYVGYLIPKGGVYQFYGLAACVGFVMGGIQSLSRSTYAKLMPETKDTTSFFSFYDVTEKIAIVIGMFSFGYITELFNGSQRNSVLALMTFFVIGFFLLFYTLQAQTKKAN
ncbi:MAG: MFS transporter [Chitinophagaceae bacterium]|nr:MFS transporter [Chitinophagaceae bacterium]